MKLFKQATKILVHSQILIKDKNLIPMNKHLKLKNRLKKFKMQFKMSFKINFK